MVWFVLVRSWVQCHRISLIIHETLLRFLVLAEVDPWQLLLLFGLVCVWSDFLFFLFHNFVPVSDAFLLAPDLTDTARLFYADGVRLVSVRRR